MMILPQYYLLAGRPVKVLRMEDGRVGTYGFNLQNGEFQLSTTLLNRVTKADNDESVRVLEEEFLKKVTELQENLRTKNPGQ